MLGLELFSAKKVKFDIKLRGKKKAVSLSYRPFTLSDLADYQENFGDEETQRKLINFDVNTCSKVIWNQLDGDSKKIFEDYCYQTKGKNCELEGYKKFIEATDGVKNFLIAMTSFNKLMLLNNFFNAEEVTGIKKKSIANKE